MQTHAPTLSFQAQRAVIYCFSHFYERIAYCLLRIALIFVALQPVHCNLAFANMNIDRLPVTLERYFPEAPV